MKIKLKIQHYTLRCICIMYDSVETHYECYPSEAHFTKEYRAVKNIVDLLLIRLKKKAVEPPKKGKYMVLSLDYNQAYFLLCFISVNITFINGILEQNLLLQLTQNIHQEL